MGWDVRRSSAFQPAGATSVSPLPATSSAWIPGLYGVSSPLAWLFRLYPLNFSLTSSTHSLQSPYKFCRWDYDVFILRPRGAPHHSDTPRHPASARALSLSLLLGLSPLAGITPAALAAPDQPAPASPPSRQIRSRQASSRQHFKQRPRRTHPNRTRLCRVISRMLPLPTLRVSSGSLDILHGGTVHVEGTGLSPEFLAHHELRSLTIAPKGSSTYANPHQRSITAALSLTPRNQLPTAVSAPT